MAYGHQQPTPTEKRIAEEMCRADGREPYEHGHIPSDGGAAVLGPLWYNYVREARLFLAALRVVSTPDQ